MDSEKLIEELKKRSIPSIKKVKKEVIVVSKWREIDYKVPSNKLKGGNERCYIR